jgi:hypothetical protein
LLRRSNGENGENGDLPRVWRYTAYAIDHES